MEFIAIAVAAWLLIRFVLKQLKRDKLMKKYQDKEIVDALMKKTFWQGESEEQLLDSLGRPAVVDQQVLKTKNEEHLEVLPGWFKSLQAKNHHREWISCRLGSEGAMIMYYRSRIPKFAEILVHEICYQYNPHRNIRDGFRHAKP